MQLDPQEFLSLVESTGKICFFDLESSGTKGDYNAVHVVSIKPYKQKPITFSVKQPGYDIKVVREAKQELEKYMCWVTYYGKGFDVKMINTRLTRWGMEPIEKRLHIDMYFTLKENLLTGRRSQAHLLRFFECEHQKMDVSPEEWNTVVATGDLTKMIARCESDTQGLESLYEKTKHLIRDIKR